MGEIIINFLVLVMGFYLGRISACKCDERKSND